MVPQDALRELEITLQKLTSTSLGRRTFLASLPLLLASCATDKHRYREGRVSDADVSLTVDDEKKMTEEVIPEIRKEYPAAADPLMQNYVSGLGQKLVRSNHLAGAPYQYNFTVVDVNYVNAFALPAGTIFVTAPLLAMTETEAELAGVVGHEVGHVKARHAAQRIDRAKKERNKSILFGVGGGLLGGAAGFGVGKLLCKKDDTGCLVKATALGAAAGAGGGLLIQKFAFMANSQEDEMEADRVGFRTSVGAGYDKRHVGTFYSKLLRMEEEHKRNNTPLLSSVTDAMSTHPPSKERVEQMNELARESNLGSQGIVSSPEFVEARNRARKWVEDHKKA